MKSGKLTGIYPVARIIGLFMSTVISALVPCESGWADGRSYPMVCRGGGDMDMSVRGWGDENTSVRLTFQPAAAPASSAPPEPGQCAWLDRIFTPDEPRALHFKFNGTVTDTHIRPNGSWELIPHAAEGGRQNAANLRTLANALKNRGTFQVHAKRTNRQFEVTRFGP